ncbi:MAG: putative heme iron utilization protein [Maribacter sp.]|jgi:putative heme iron utilization protein
MLKNDLLDTSAFNEASENYIRVYVGMPRNKNLLSSKQIQHNKELVAQHN